MHEHGVFKTGSGKSWIYRLGDCARV